MADLRQIAFIWNFTFSLNNMQIMENAQIKLSSGNGDGRYLNFIIMVEEVFEPRWDVLLDGGFWRSLYHVSGYPAWLPE